MSKIKLYGISHSRAAHVLWALKELGLEFEQVPVDPWGNSKEPWYLAINPNGKVPALDDGDVRMFESLAINLYLAKKYGSAGAAPLWPAGDAAEAQTLQWTLWAASEVEPNAIGLFLEKVMKPEAARDPAAIAAFQAKLEPPFKVLEGVLAGREWLVADHFTIADLNLATVLSVLRMAEVDLSAHPRVDAWLGRCLARPGHS